MQLKPYQDLTLAALRGFLEKARVAGPATAYAEVTAVPEVAQRLGRYRGAYRALDALPGVPYVCLRLPTGGGKTILGAHAIAVARDAWIEKEYPLVLWLVPTSTIRLQTVDALKNPAHAYRRVLDEAFGGRVRVFDIADFTQVRPHDLREQCCVVVGTIQTLRVANTEGRRVYAHHEEMEPHFSAVPAATPGLEQREGGGPKFSFANLLNLHRPLMIVDEAHNAVTGLTREMQERVNPCAIVEFTATPRTNSNILFSVSAQELKQAAMIKLPIVLAEESTWQAAVAAAIAQRAALATAARNEPNYLRPIVLFQAQPRNLEVTVERLMDHLIDSEGIDETKIAVATGAQRELDGIDLFDPSCPIEYVITVEALKEGWDCSFAYVFCSVQRLRDATDAEQLLGRVLRMPYAQHRREAALNRAYAFVSEQSFGAAARGLVDKLVAMGFEETEAQDNIEPAQGHLDETGLFAPRGRLSPAFRQRFTPAPDGGAALVALSNAPTVTVTHLQNGEVEVTVAGALAPEIEDLCCTAAPTAKRGELREAAERYRADRERQLSPADRGEPFTTPRLMTHIQGQLEFADTDILMEFHDWRLTDHAVRLTAQEFAVREVERRFEVDVEGGRVVYQFANEVERLAFEGDLDRVSPQDVVLWLDRNLRQPDIHQSDLVRWLSETVGHLTGERGIEASLLMRMKFVLARALRDRIERARATERAGVYQRYLFAPEAQVEVSFDHAFTFDANIYPDVARYRGAWRATKHFLGADRVAAFDGAEGGEEMQCAQALDSLPQVRFWLRNVARHPHSFWLPTASDKFYPDFVAQITDGRLFVVEYKGALRDEADLNEKRAIGRLWQERSAGRGVFLLVERMVERRDMREQMRHSL